MQIRQHYAVLCCVNWKLVERYEPRYSWRQLEQQCPELPFSQSQQQQPEQQQQQYRVPAGFRPVAQCPRQIAGTMNRPFPIPFKKGRIQTPPKASLVAFVERDAFCMVAMRRN